MISIEPSGYVIGNTPQGEIIADNPTKIERYMLVALRSALRLESVGLKKSHGHSAASLVRTQIKSKTRDKVKLLSEYEAWLRQRGYIQ